MPVLPRTDVDALQERAVAKAMKNGPQRPRLSALAAIYDGGICGAADQTGELRRKSCSTALMAFE